MKTISDALFHKEVTKHGIIHSFCLKHVTIGKERN